MTLNNELNCVFFLNIYSDFKIFVYVLYDIHIHKNICNVHMLYVTQARHPRLKIQSNLNIETKCNEKNTMFK